MAPQTHSMYSPHNNSTLPLHKFAVKKSPKVLFDRYEVDREVGTGSSSTVYLAHDVRNGLCVALKQVARARRRRSECALLREVTAQRHVHGHGNVIEIYDVIETEESYTLVEEYVEGGDLASLLLGENVTSAAMNANLSTILLDVVDALAYLHERNVVHLDMKPENVLLTREARAKLGDFGHACFVLNDENGKTELKRLCSCCDPTGLAQHLVVNNDRCRSKTSGQLRREHMKKGWEYVPFGTHAYLAPEVYDGAGSVKDYKAIDVWALGIILHIIVTRSFPWQCSMTYYADSEDEISDDEGGDDERSLFLRRCSARLHGDSRFLQYLRTGTHRDWATLPPEMVKLLKGLLCVDPSERLSMEEVKAYVVQTWPDDWLARGGSVELCDPENRSNGGGAVVFGPGVNVGSLEEIRQSNPAMTNSAAEGGRRLGTGGFGTRRRSSTTDSLSRQLQGSNSSGCSQQGSVSSLPRVEMGPLHDYPGSKMRNGGGPGVYGDARDVWDEGGCLQNATVQLGVGLVIFVPLVVAVTGFWSFF